MIYFRILKRENKENWTGLSARHKNATSVLLRWPKTNDERLCVVLYHDSLMNSGAVGG